MDIEVKGDITSDDMAWIYDWLGISYTSPKKVNDALIKANGEDVTVKINSGGGDIFAASEIYTSLMEYKGNVVTQGVGLVASAASVILMGGKIAKLSPTAMIMVHNVSSSAAGDYRDMNHMSEVLKTANDTIANAYITKTGMSREAALELMNNETWMSAQKAKEYGLIDEIMFADKPNINLSEMSNSLKGKLYNSSGLSIPQNILDMLNNQQKPSDKDTVKADFLLQQKKAKSKLQLLNLRRN